MTTDFMMPPRPADADDTGYNKDGWYTDYAHLEKIKKHIGCEHLSLEEIETVIWADYALRRGYQEAQEENNGS